MTRQILKFHESEPLLNSDPARTENHTDFGQFHTDSSSPASSHSQIHTDFGQFRTDSAINAQPSTINSHQLWQRQPNEPAGDYQLFTAWLELPAPRLFSRSAPVLAVPVYRLRRIAARHHWKSRAAAFDNHRADASSRALDQLLQQETLNWKERTEHFRLQEWALHEEMLQAARAAARALHQRPCRVSLHAIARLYELALTLGRRAVGLPLDPAQTSPRIGPPPLEPEWEEALRKIYGSPPESADRPDPTAASSAVAPQVQVNDASRGEQAGAIQETSTVGRFRPSS